MGVDWWSYWSEETGFDLAKFERHYRERTEKPTLTHRRVALLRSLLRPYGLKCLVTNAFANERPGGHRGGTSNVDVLRRSSRSSRRSASS